ncbi:MAG: dihydrolipoamide acetyltransferase family protein [Ignavibacteriales bacterium]|nr:dihydrolipoamide acetyltransferase family protein [Ignavibacteriales bacterium]
MLVEVVMPKMGESIQEGKILRWMKKPGDKIEQDESMLEISTDKVDAEIPSPSAGFLSRILVPEGETVEVGKIIAVIETDAGALKIEQTTAVSSKPATVDATPLPATAPVIAGWERKEQKREGERFYSPLVRSIARKEGVSIAELDRVQGTGLSGRVTKHDLGDYLRNRTGRSGPFVQAPLARVDIKELQAKYPPPQFEVVQMDNVQMKMAEHMVRSVQTSPHVEAISECDCSRIVDFRSKNAAQFETQEGFKLTFMPFIVDAAIQALKAFPLVNSSLEGDKIILKKSINFGIAVASPTGLIVPVIKNAEGKNFLGLARAINDLAVRTRTKRLMPDEIQGGTFTVTNYGVFGNIIGTPIINQPQVAILGIGAIKKRPMVLTDAQGNDTIAIRSMAYLTLAFDHRIIDGALGGQFLAKVVSNLEQYDFTRTS